MSWESLHPSLPCPIACFLLLCWWFQHVSPWFPLLICAACESVSSKFLEFGFFLVKEVYALGVVCCHALRLRVHVYGMSDTCPHDFFKNQYSGVPTRTSDRMSQWFPMNITLHLLIESSLVRLQRARISHLRAKRASNGSCCCWKFLRQFARPDAHWLQYTSRFSACGTALQGHTKSFWQKSIPVCFCLLTKFVGTCSERM